MKAFAEVLGNSTHGSTSEVPWSTNGITVTRKHMQHMRDMNRIGLTSSSSTWTCSWWSLHPSSCWPFHQYLFTSFSSSLLACAWSMVTSLGTPVSKWQNGTPMQTVASWRTCKSEMQARGSKCYNGASSRTCNAILSYFNVQFQCIGSVWVMEYIKQLWSIFFYYVTKEQSNYTFLLNY